MIAALINHLWQSTLFCVAIWLITLGLRSNGAALRHRLWLFASFKFLVPFSALYFIGSLAGVAAPIASQPVFLNQAIQVAAPVVWPTDSLQHLTLAPRGGLSIALVAIWSAGALLIGLRWLHAWRAANSLVRAARPAPGTSLDARLTDAHVEPAVAGSFHPVVLLPVALLGSLAPAQLRAVLAHEHEHIRRHDNLKAHIHRLVETLFWFHPAAWWIGRRMVEERERACDEAVIDHGHDVADYATAILAACEHCLGHARAPASVAALAGDLPERIRRILSGKPPAMPGAFKSAALLLGTLAVAGVPLLSGAADDSVRRQTLLAINSRMLATADISITPAAGTDSRSGLRVAGREVVIRNSTVRGLVALAFDVEPWQVKGDGEWMDDLRYDVRVVAPAPVSEPEHLDPVALRGIVTKLLGARFDLEIHVNQLCQAPCGRHALETGSSTG